MDFVGTAIKQFSAGSGTYVIKTDGTLWAWGSHGDGQIGADDAWCDVSAGPNFQLATKCDGSLWAWGDNYYGELGTGDNVDRNTPTRIGNDNDWASVATPHLEWPAESFATKADGTLWAWGGGLGYVDQLGLAGVVDTTPNVPTAVPVGGWVAVVPGGYDTIGLQSDGSIRGWGQNDEVDYHDGLHSGLLGDGPTNRTSPVAVSIPGPWDSVAAGGDVSAGIKGDGSLWMWGYDTVWGENLPMASATPVPVGSDSSWAQVAGLDSSSSSLPTMMALKTDGTLWRLDIDAAGAPSPGTSTIVATHVGSGNDWVKVAGASGYYVMLKSDGTIWTSGDGSSLTPALGFGDWINVAASGGDVIALRSDGTAWEWGNTLAAHEVAPDKAWDDIAIEEVDNAVAIQADGTLWQWSTGGYGSAVDEPMQLTPADNWQRLAAGTEVFFGLSTDGALWAWGNGFDGQLGTGADQAEGQVMPTVHWNDIAASEYTSLGLGDP